MPLFKLKVLAACLFGLGLSSIAAQAEELNLLCSPDVKWCELMVQKFEEKTGIKVNAVRLSAGEAYARIRAEARNPKSDVWWGGSGDTYVQAAQEGLLAEYKSPQMADLHPWAQHQAEITNYRSVATESSAIGFAYNEKILKEKGLQPPACWADLAKPEYKGEVQVANPNSAGTAYFALATIVQLMGEDPAFDYLKKLNANVSAYPKSGSAPVKAAARGETGIAIAFSHDILALIDEGFPLKSVSPCEGTAFQVAAVGIVKGARHMDAAKKWIEWALSPEAQSMAGQAKMYSMPSNTKATVPEAVKNMLIGKTFNYDGARFGAARMRSHLLKRWTDEIGAKAQ
ncbi:MAG: iron ABC transporter substrate-binding protein [Rhizobiales bacterium 63-22]|nr:MAG: iron ABC transporter substrate-binding protein [Rhizobiales bacterium 63-22]